MKTEESSMFSKTLRVSLIAVAGLLAVPPAARAAGCGDQSTQADLDVCADQDFQAADKALNQAFREIDLMLDAWPAPGSTTTLEALSNGVPVLALDGEPPTLTGGYRRAMLEASGLPELIACSPDDFVARALDLAEDPARLDTLRARVRPGFEGGPICDGAAFTRRLESAFAAMFDDWRNDGRQTT